MPKKFKPSAAARPSAVKIGGSGADCVSATRPYFKEAKHSNRAERSGRKVLLDCNSNQRAAKTLSARRNGAGFALIFPRIRALMRRPQKKNYFFKVLSH
jgi:hypothetical protein